MQATVRIELGAGDYALILKELRHKTSRLVKECLRKYLKPRTKPVMLSEIQGDTKLDDVEIDMDKFNTEETAEIILLNQVIEWSFGAVNQESLDNIPTLKYENLAMEVDKLYSSVPLAVKS